MVRIATGLLISALVFGFAYLVGWIKIIPLNDSFWLGLAAITVVYYVGSLVIVLTSALVAAVAGAVLGGMTGEEGCTIALATVGALLGGLVGELLFLGNAYKLVEWFPTFTFWSALFVALATTAFGFRANYNGIKKE